MNQATDILRLRQRIASLLLVGTLSSWAQAATVDPQVTPDIPEAPATLPLPYGPAPDAGRPPPAFPLEDAELPPPLARAPEHPRRPLEVGLGLGVFLPSCGSGSIDDRGCRTAAPGTGLDLALLYRVTPHFAAGAEGIVSQYRASAQGVLNGGGGRTRFLGVAGRLYFAEDGPWDPYLALTLGAGTLALGSAEQSSTTGFGGRVQAGIDYALSQRLRVGPAGSLARWWSAGSCDSGFCDPYGKPLGFATLGLRLTASFGDPL